MSDGTFMWWWSLGAEPESYRGPCETREEAIAEAQGDGGKEEGFTICEADRSVPTPHIFRADRVFDDYGEHNEECWGEDGADVQATPEQEADLEQMLGDAFDAWFKKHGISQRGWAFGEQRREQYFPPEEKVAAVE